MKTLIRPNGIATLIILAAISLLILRPIDSFDIWWHLNSGLWMFENRQVLDHDVWSYTVFGQQWVNVAWLFQLLIAGFYQLAGSWGLLLVKYLLVFALYFMYWSIASRKSGFMAYLLSIIILMPFMVGHFHLRPHMIELLLIASVILLAQREWKHIHILLGFLVLIIWANTHASVIVGATALSVQALFGSWKDQKSYKERIIVAALFAIPLVITPYGLSFIELLLAHGDSESIDYYVNEWVIEGYFPELLWIISALVAISGLSKRLRLTPAEWYLLIFFFIYAMQFKRFELELSVVLLAPLAAIVQAGINLGDNGSGKRLSRLLAVLFILSHVSIYYLNAPESGRFLRQQQPIQWSNYPVITTRQLADLAEKLERKVRVLNDYGMGGYLAFASDSLVSVFVDGRMSTVFPERFVIPQYEEKSDIRGILAERYQVDAILLSQASAVHMGDGGEFWRRVGYDSASVLYIREELADKHNIKTISYDPSFYHSGYPKETVSRFYEETRGYLDKYPDNVVALNHMAVFVSSRVKTRQEADEVFGMLEQVEYLDSLDIFSRATMAFLYGRWYELDERYLYKFIEVLPDANDMGAEISDSYFRLFATRLLELKLPKLAKDYLYPESMERRRRMDESPGVWMERALMHHALDENKKTENSLDIARELIDDKNLDALQQIESLRNNLLRNDVIL